MLVSAVLESTIVPKAVADRLAEAFAEYLHAQARKDWGYAKDESLSGDDLIAEMNDLNARMRGTPMWGSVLDNLRFVLHVARGYQGYGLPQADQRVVATPAEAGAFASGVAVTATWRNRGPFASNHARASGRGGRSIPSADVLNASSDARYSPSETPSTLVMLPPKLAEPLFAVVVVTLTLGVPSVPVIAGRGPEPDTTAAVPGRVWTSTSMSSLPRTCSLK